MIAMHAPRIPQHASRGFSMIELMVAMVISLIGMIIIFQVFEVNEGIKRTTTAGGDAQQNGAIALYTIESDLRNAGMGFNDTAYAGCSIAAYDANRSPTNFPVAPATMPMVPVRITPGGSATAPDSMSIFYGSQSQVSSSTTITANMASATAPLKVTSHYGYRTGDLILVLQPGSSNNCVIMEVTSLPTTDQVNHDSGTYTLDWVASGAQTKSARFNPAAGLGVTYTGANTANAARVYNLGNLYDKDGNFSLTHSHMPVYNTYAISSNALTQASGFSTAAATSLADNIVHMRILYGMDDGSDNDTVNLGAAPVFTAGDGIIDRWLDGSSTPNWQYLVAVRVAVVARSALPEKPAAGAGQPCDTTAAAPTWSGSAWSALGLQTSFDLSADANWKCYRYRVFETTVPLRNWIWKSS